MFSGLREDLTHAILPKKKQRDGMVNHCFLSYFHPMLIPFKRLNSRLMIKQEE